MAPGMNPMSISTPASATATGSAQVMAEDIPAIAPATPFMMWRPGITTPISL